MATKNYLDDDGLRYYHSKVKALIETAEGKIPTVPTDISAFNNDSGYITESALTGYTKDSSLARVAKSGSYTDLSDKPTIPAAQVNADWNATTGKAQILNKPALKTVATSGSYNDLSNKPTIPTVHDSTLTIQKNGNSVGTFSNNQSTNETINITVPTNTNELTNGAGFQTASEVSTAITAAIAGISGVQFEIVSQLPASGQSGVFYLLANGSTAETNIYDEYIWIATSKKYEKIGTTAADLTDYLKKTDIVAITNTEIDNIVK